MSKRGAGVAFVAVAALLFVARYLAAAIYMSGLPSQSANLFSAGLQYVGGAPTTLSVVALIVGAVYLVWAEIEALASRRG